MADGPDTIVLIHGLWMTPLSWEHWAARYEGRGYRVLAPAWPGLEAPVEELRRDPTPLTQLSIAKIVDNYDRDHPRARAAADHHGPLLRRRVHADLVDRGLGAAGVRISAATVKGIYDLPLSTIRSTTAILGNPFSRGKATPITEERFRYAFGNMLTEAESKAAYDRYAVPSANRVLWEGAFANFAPGTAAKVNFGNDERAPLLFIGAGQDHVVPAKVSRKLAQKHSASKVPAEYKEFSGRSHYLVGQDGWEEIADYALDWAEKNAKAS